MIHAATWMNLKNILYLLYPDYILFDFHLYEILEETMMGEKIRIIVAFGWGWRLTWKKHKGSYWGHGNSLHVDRSFGSKVFVLVENYSIQ